MQINDGAKIVDKLRQGGFDVAAAWWMKSSGEGLWFLYVASKQVDELGITAAYMEALSLIRQLGPLWVDRFEIKLVRPTHPTTQDVLRILKGSPSPLATRYDGTQLGSAAIDGAYLYPLPDPVSCD